MTLRYVSGNKRSRSRILWLSILRLLTILHTLWFGLSTVFRNETMRTFQLNISME